MTRLKFLLLIAALSITAQNAAAQTNARSVQPPPRPIDPAAAAAVESNAAPEAPTTPQARPQPREQVDSATKRDTALPAAKRPSRLPPTADYGAPAFPAPLEASIARDAKAQEARQQAVISFYSAIASQNQSLAHQEIRRYNDWVFENRKAVFQWQQFAGKVIFIVMILLVFTGVMFSGIQFYIAMSRHGKVADGAAGLGSPTTVEASIKGIKVSSSILGVVLLFLSFMFFYLYLRHVFPVTIIGAD